MTKSPEMFLQLRHRELQLGFRQVPVFEVAPCFLPSTELCHLLRAAQQAVDLGAVLMVSGAIGDYTGPDGNKDMDVNTIMARSSLAASLRDAYVFGLDNKPIRGLLDAREDDHLAVTSVAVVASLVKKLGGSPETVGGERSYPIITSEDFQAFSHLWDSTESQHNAMEYGEKNPGRALFMTGIGEVLGGMHDLNYIHGDTHLGNFILEKSGRVVVLDFENSALLLRSPTCHECARDMTGLLPEITAGDWAWFKRGYITKRKVEGACTVNVVELGNEFRSSVLMSMGHYENALPMLQAELAERLHQGEEDPCTELSNIGMCCGKLGRHEEGLSYCKRALDAVAPDNTPAHLRAVPIHNLGMAYYRLGRHNEAIECFQQVADNSDMQTHKGLWMEALWHLANSLLGIGQQGSALYRLDQLLPLAERYNHQEINALRELHATLTKNGVRPR